MNPFQLHCYLHEYVCTQSFNDFEKPMFIEVKMHSKRKLWKKSTNSGLFIYEGGRGTKGRAGLWAKIYMSPPPPPPNKANIFLTTVICHKKDPHLLQTKHQKEWPPTLQPITHTNKLFSEKSCQLRIWWHLPNYVPVNEILSCFQTIMDIKEKSQLTVKFNLHLLGKLYFYIYIYICWSPTSLLYMT